MRPKAGSASQVHASQTHCQPLDWWTFTVSTFDKLVNKTWIRKCKYFKMVTSILLTQLLSPGGNGGIEPSTAPRHVVRGTIGSTSWQGFWGSIWRKSWWCTLDASRSCRHWFWTEKLQCRVLGSEHLKDLIQRGWVSKWSSTGTCLVAAEGTAVAATYEGKRAWCQNNAGETTSSLAERPAIWFWVSWDRGVF